MTESPEARDLLGDWRDRFAELDGVEPWPGPVPLTSSAGRAVGRAHDRDQMLAILRNKLLVVLHADSGVGKSSFLAAELQPAMQGRFTSFRIPDWSEFAVPERRPSPTDGESTRSVPPLSVDALLFTKLFPERPLEDLEERAEPDQDLLGPRPLGVFLEREYGRNVVLILDQFEELIRDSPSRFEQASRWIDAMIRHHGIRIIVSLRSEYFHRVKELGARSGRAQMIREYALSPIVDPRFIRQIVEGDGTGTQSRMTIEPPAAEAVLELWETATKTVDDDLGPIGLLHLQALLYVVAHMAKAKRRTVVQLRDVERLVSAAEHGDSVFRAAMTRAVERKLDHCEKASKEAGIDDSLRIGAKASAQRSVGHLSSGGYKLVVRDSDLFVNAFDRELRVHRPSSVLSAHEFNDLASTVRDRLVVPGSPLDSGGTALWPEDQLPWISDEEEMSAGPMMGMSSQRVMTEEVRRFLFGLTWLERAQLVRTATPTPGRTMIALIHDAYSEPLERWARGGSVTREEAVHFLTAARGETFDWRHPESGPSEEAHVAAFEARAAAAGDEARARTRIIANLRWRDCRVTARFEQVTFVNCDFQGTRFDGCEFEGVVFLNCRLDGASIRNSRIVGRVRSNSTVFSPSEPPSFFVDGVDAHETIRTLITYRGGPSAADRLFSDTSGLPVRAVDSLPSGEGGSVTRWEPEKGGLAFYGGRVYSLMLERCDFGGEDAGEGSLALYAISGSSLDIVDPADAHVIVRGSAIRGLSVTVNDEVRRGPQTRNIHLEVSDALLASTWFGDELVGTAEFDDCVLWQLWNNSELTQTEGTEGLKVEVRNSSYLGLVNVETIDSDCVVLGALAAPPVFDLSKPGSARVVGAEGVSGRLRRLTRTPGSSMAAGANRMEYQVQPAEQEFRRRRISSTGDDSEDRWSAR